MASQQPVKPPTEDTRRDFIRGSSMLLAAALPTRGGQHKAAGNHALRVGLIGCGRRGVTLAVEALSSSFGKIEIAALADVFSDRVQQAYRTLKGRSPNAVTVQPEMRFVGLDAFERLMDTDVDIVILATPPFFRPEHFESAIDGRKHVFSEKPIAVDLLGVRRFSDAGKKALDLGLCVAVGKHRHLMAPADGRWADVRSHLRSGIIGDLISIQLVSIGRALSKNTRMGQSSELDHQLRNWQQYEWLGGDPMLEQQIHLLDIANELMGSCPRLATAESVLADSNGPSVRVRYVYPGGQDVLSTYVAAATSGASSQQFEIFGTKGRCDLISRRVFDLRNRPMSLATVSPAAPRTTAMDELIVAIQSGFGMNEYRSAAESTLTALMGQLALKTSIPQTWAEFSHV